MNARPHSARAKQVTEAPGPQPWSILNLRRPRRLPQPFPRPFGDERGPQAANIESGGGGLWEGVPKRLKLSIVEGGCILEGLVINFN